MTRSNVCTVAVVLATLSLAQVCFAQFKAPIVGDTSPDSRGEIQAGEILEEQLPTYDSVHVDIADDVPTGKICHVHHLLHIISELTSLQKH